MNATPATLSIIVLNIAVFMFDLSGGSRVLAPFALWPIGSGFDLWQVVTYGFLHGGIGHIFFNMFGVYMFGSELERVWGSNRFLIYYMTCVIAAAIVQIIFSMMIGSRAPTVGASGGVFGLLLAYAMLFPQRKFFLIFLPVPIPAWLFVTLYGLLELYLGVTGTQAGVAHFAHLGGMLGGFLLLRSGRRRR
ncbi:MAG: rhomboid family intramembrane serine protease [Betaproteobacteria bacterium]|nr:rhomboid family intramembrane serine protease [Betaproteobacteria bacterium]